MNHQKDESSINLLTNHLYENLKALLTDSKMDNVKFSILEGFVNNIHIAQPVRNICEKCFLELDAIQKTAETSIQKKIDLASH